MSKKLNELNMRADIYPKVLIVFVIWTAVTVVVAVLMTGGGNATLEDLVRDGVLWSALLAAVIAVGAAYYFRVPREVGMTPLASNAVWIPLIVQAVVIAALFLRGFILSPQFSTSQFLWIGLNTLFVGISEEMMFRGLLFSGLYNRYSYWIAIIGVAVLFGAVHILNAFITGEIAQGFLQAGLATFSGLLFMAMRLGMGSIIPAMIMHWLWDFSVFLNPASSYTTGTPSGLDLAIGGLATVGPVVFGIVGLFYIWRLRKRIEGGPAPETA